MFTGGGTLGPVTPLLALAEVWKKADPSVRFVWIGTERGPERALVEDQGIFFHTIPTVRLPRYLSVEWLLLPIRFVMAFVETCRILSIENPSLIASASGYVSVLPVIIGRLKGIPSWIHQQDVAPVLANRVMAPFVSSVTVAWPESVKDFPAKKTALVGNPVRPSVLAGKKERALKEFGFESRQTILVLGGGGGSAWINEQMSKIGGDLVSKANVIHITGPGKKLPELDRIGKAYRAVELMTKELPDAFALADIVVARAGMGTITELVALKKASVIIALPNSPQLLNADEVRKASAGIVLEQEKTTAEDLKNVLLKLAGDPAERARLGKNMGGLFDTDVAGKLVERLEKLAK